MKRQLYKTDITTVLLHWCFVLSIGIAIFSGARIAYDHVALWRSIPYLSQLIELTPFHTVFVVHLSNGFLLTLLLLMYLIYLAYCRQMFRLSLSGYGSKKKSQTNIITRWITISAIWMMGISCITGVINYFAPISFITGFSRWLHLNVAVIWLLYPLVHVISQYYIGGISHILSILMVHKAYARQGMLALITVSVIGSTLYFYERLFPKTLIVTKTNTIPVIDGVADDPIWAKVNPLTINTQLGNDDDVVTPVTVKSLHNGERLFLLIRWPDRTKSLEHLPLSKENRTWVVKHNGFGYDDERTYYEDKLAVMLANDYLAAMKSIHLGLQPLKKYPISRSGRGYHYTEGQTYDVWQWKAVRTNSLYQADDAYFASPWLARECEPRYVAGFHYDPKLRGGYTYNWAFFLENGIRPKRLPRSSRHIFKQDNTANTLASQRPMWMRWSDATPYSDKLDRINNESMMPSILSLEPFQGDRGDVGARGQWQNGFWHLEISRALKTDSDYDVEISDGVYVWFSVFNHAQTRHSYHLRPIKLKLNDSLL